MPPIDPQDRACLAAPFQSLAHGIEKIACLEGDRFQGCPRKFRRSGIAGQPEDRPRVLTASQCGAPSPVKAGTR